MGLDMRGIIWAVRICICMFYHFLDSIILYSIKLLFLELPNSWVFSILTKCYGFSANFQNSQMLLVFGIFCMNFSLMSFLNFIMLQCTNTVSHLHVLHTLFVHEGVLLSARYLNTWEFFSPSNYLFKLIIQGIIFLKKGLFSAKILVK